MARVKGAMMTRKRRNKVLKLAKGYFGSKHFQSKILPFSITYSTFKEINLFDDVYTVDKALDVGMNLARSRLLDTLEKDSKILSQKKLKLYTKDSKIFIEVFFKVYENITDYCDIVLEGE